MNLLKINVMKKLLVTLSVVLCLSVATIAQNTFNQGDKVINLGIGFGSTLYTGSYYTNKTPPISGAFEIGIKDNLFDDKSSIGIGGYLGYTGAKWEQSGYGWKYSNIILGARGALHYQLIDNLDTYTGLMVGYNMVSSSAIGSGAYGGSTALGSGLRASWFLGGRYYFTEKVAGLLELGYGVSYLNLGIAFKL